ncbi:phosphatidate cytidylyltransferase [uncultured Agrococcus sp.]|uniref:phosphatidate cytidylyltransferase n=1 Tax=uncultured Agrococcus sp. TaxID=382258 RepID=UPI0025DC7363|nr:phosphatidate cytidylyltransferase [uncultured Agrococcus sp.]
MSENPEHRQHNITDQIRLAREQVEAVNERVNKRAGRNIPIAIGVGLVFGAIVFVSLIFLKGLFVVVAVALVAFCLYEISSALRFAGRDVPRVPLIVVGALVMPLTWFFGSEGLWFGIVAAALFTGLWRIGELLFNKKTRTGFRAVVADMAAGVLCLAYVAVFAGFAVLLLQQPGGEWWIIAFVAVTVIVDTGALVSGVLFGKHKLAPRISPGKTWEGLIGAAVLALVAGVLLSIFLLELPWWFGLIFGACILIASTVGDLFESLMKRDLAIKDISSVLPGHGGFLDRLDSVLPSAAVALALYQIAL